MTMTSFTTMEEGFDAEGNYIVRELPPLEEITVNEFKSTISGKGIHIVRFGGKNCPPCNDVDLVIQEVRANHKDSVNAFMLDISKRENYGSQQSIEMKKIVGLVRAKASNNQVSGFEPHVGVFSNGFLLKTFTEQDMPAFNIALNSLININISSK